MKNFILACLGCMFSLFPLSAQEVNKETGDKLVKVRPIRLGAKIGLPNLVGGNLEYVSPLFGNKLALSLDLSTLRSEWFEPEDQTSQSQSESFKFSYLEGGLNYYLFKPGKGLYTGIAYSQIGINGVKYDLKSNDGTNSGGISRIDYRHNSFNIKLGAKLGGLFYFRPEIGYMFSPPPASITIDVEFDDGSREFQDFGYDTEGSPLDLFFLGFIANFGFGFAF